MAGCVFQVANSSGNVSLIHPGLAISQVELPQCGRKPALEQDLTRSGALGGFRQVGISLNPLPSHSLKLFTEWLFDEVVFPLDFTHARASAARIVSGVRTRPVSKSAVRPDLSRLSFQRFTVSRLI